MISLLQDVSSGQASLRAALLDPLTDPLVPSPHWSGFQYALPGLTEAEEGRKKCRRREERTAP